jgi:hypothetical protein
LAALKALCEQNKSERAAGVHGYAKGSPCDKRWSDARAAIAECEPEPIPVGEAQDSDFGAFMDEVRK